MPSQKHAIRVYVSDEEHQAITAKAESAGLSCSCYAKRICLGFPISSKVDAGAVRELIRTRADLGRLGGLLKMWLTNEDEHILDIKTLLEQIEQGQKDVLKAVNRL
jgi:hypothetical protein